MKSLILFISSSFLYTPSYAMELGDGELKARSGTYAAYKSPSELPAEFQISAPKIRELNYVDFDTLELPASRGKHFYASWNPRSLEDKGYVAVQALPFLKFTPDDFERIGKGLYDLRDGAPKKLELYFGNFWNQYTSCASLISPSHPDVYGSYGIVLEIPPQLILRLYPEDATSASISTWVEDPADLVQKRILDVSYMSYTKEYCPGPVSLMNDAKEGNNEIVFSPVGTSEGKSYSVSIKGLYVKDKDYLKRSKYHTQPSNTDPLDIFQIKELAKELNLPVLKLSDFVSKGSRALGDLKKDSSFPLTLPVYEEAADQWGRPMSDPKFGLPPAS